MNILSFEKMLLIVLIIASISQLYLSFIKGRAPRKDNGEILLRLSASDIKRKFLAILFLGLMGYFIYVIITGYFTALGVMIVVYFLLSIYDFSKEKVVTDKGIGQKSLYSNVYYNFSYWKDIEEWHWSDKKENQLLFKIKIKDKVETKDWQVSSLEKEKIEELFKKYIESDSQ
ncbi:hypothetical protein P8V03_12455 [Clostridium sp. A1-XYC3]|uniref:Bacterial PH domain-containing protein n=1 Tax=Clostridium tanneri TaxID=3037988 RepID=A0ABU4JUY2_9CLOT|nr:hypothetical protein [Clostridium sp. A1-XYC3]MDW8801960.1 hypothetical protein [Clostridium sp. A1-XYC3]